MNKHIIVIGAGIVGISTAIWLQRYGCKVTIVDKQVTGQAASYGNAGVLASSSIIPVTVPGLLAKAPKMLFSQNQPLFLRWSYLLKLLPWLGRYLSHCNTDDVERIARALLPIVGNSLQDHQELTAGTPAAAFIHPDDYVFLYDSRAHYEGDAFAWNLRRELGYQWDVLEGESVAEYDPVLAHPERVLIPLGNHGRIPSPGNYIKTLTDYALDKGAELITGEVAEFIIENGRISGVRTAEQQTLSADAVALTTGAWSAGLGKKLGLHVPLESERGYHVELIGASIMPRFPTMVASGKFVMTPMEDRLRLAGVVEFGGIEAEASNAPHELLFRNIHGLLPGINWQDDRKWLGHRPAPVDSIPLIGKINNIQGLFTGCGHHHIGLTGGPRTGKSLAQLITGRDNDIDLAPYQPDRFAL